MAIAVSAIVSPKASGNNSAASPSPNGPLFGIVSAGSGPWNVLWNNGSLVESIPAISLDEILPADSSVSDSFVGRRAKITSPTGQNNWGIGVCITAYKRDAVNTLLLQLGTGAYVEVAAASAEAVN